MEGKYFNVTPRDPNNPVDQRVAEIAARLLDAEWLKHRRRIEEEFGKLLLAAVLTGEDPTKAEIDAAVRRVVRDSPSSADA